jgi:hypothetical protein
MTTTMLSRVFRVLSQRVPAASLMRSARMFGGHSHHAAPAVAIKAAPAELNTEEVGEEPNGAIGQFEIDEATRTFCFYFAPPSSALASRHTFNHNALLPNNPRPSCVNRFQAPSSHRRLPFAYPYHFSEKQARRCSPSTRTTMPRTFSVRFWVSIDMSRLFFFLFFLFLSVFVFFFPTVDCDQAPDGREGNTRLVGSQSRFGHSRAHTNTMMFACARAMVTACHVITLVRGHSRSYCCLVGVFVAVGRVAHIRPERHVSQCCRRFGMACVCLPVCLPVCLSHHQEFQ